MTIAELLSDIRSLSIVLPEFQREYVWSREQAKQLLVSLYRGYPTGALLFWKTSSPPDIKNNAVDPSTIGTTQVILDGQQRLTTLYLLTLDAIPPYYTQDDIQTDPRNLYFNLDDEDLLYYQPSRMANNPTWVPVTMVFGSGGPINVFEIAKDRAESDGEAFAIAQRYNDNLARLRSILEKQYRSRPFRRQRASTRQ